MFCDLSTPQANGCGFSVYDDLRVKLIERGVPSGEIAFIQDYDEDAAKASLFKNVREGRVRILLGSTPKMGEGTNVQRRLVALHHLDAPWRPADIEQRDGRILRQGNTNECVSIFRYVTEGSFDAYMWQTLETKCRFIAQVMTGDATMRRAEDVDAAALTYAEVKAIASGNPLVIEKASIDAEVLRLTRLKRQHADSQYHIRCRIRAATDSIATGERHIAEITADLATRTSAAGDAFTMTIQGETFTDRVKAGRALVFLAAAMKPFTNSKPLGEIAGFTFTLHRLEAKTTLTICGKHTYQSNVSESPTGTIASLEHALATIPDQLTERESDHRRHIKQREDLTKQLGLPFEHDDRLGESTKRQQEIISALDITKNQAPANVGDASETTADTVQRAGKSQVVSA